MSDVTTKHCVACKQTKPICEFSKRKANRDGLRCQCKACDAQYRCEHREERIQYNRDFTEAHPDYYKNYRLAHSEVIREQQKKSQSKNEWKYQDRILTYRQSHKRQTAERTARWRNKHPAQIKAQAAKYHTAHPEVQRMINQRRKARKRMLPSAFRLSDFYFSLNYWHGVCAYCGYPPSMFDRYTVLHAEHFIPLSSPDCPGTIPTNMLPACQTCNQSKGNKDPIKWLIAKFGSRKAKTKLIEIKTYFGAVKEKEDVA